MKFIELSYIVLLLNVAMAVINASGMVDGFQLSPAQNWFDAVGKDQLQDDQYFQSSAQQQSSTSFGFGDFVKGLALFLTTFALGIVVVPYTFIQFGLPAGFAALLSIPVYVSYAYAISQFVSNRSGKGME